MTVGGPVVFLGHSAAPSGAELAFARLARALVRRRSAVHVIVLAPGPLLDALAGAAIPTSVVPSRAANVRRSARAVVLVAAALCFVVDGVRVGGELRRLQAAAVVAHSPKALLVGVVAARRARLPLVWYVHDHITAEHFGLLHLPLRLLGRFAADGYLANSAGTMRTLRTGGKPRAVCRPGVDIAALPRPRHQREPDSVVIVVVGALTPWKGQDLVLRAVSSMTTRPRVRVVGGPLFGDHAFARSLHDLAGESGIADRVRFTGHVDDPLAEIADADVLVHYPRRAEPFGQVVAEAMAAGRAVVAAARGGPAELLSHGRTGLLVPPGKPEVLAAVLDRLITDLPLRHRLGAAARERARHFSLDASASAALTLLSEVLPEPRR